MIEYERKALQGVPDYRAAELLPKRSEYCLLIPVINEGARILTELGRAQTAGVDTLCDIVICDGGSTDGSMKLDTLQLYGVNTLLTKTGPGKQGAQLRMGIYFALNRGYKGVLTIDGNNKDSIEDVHKFIEKLQAGYDFVQGSRFIRGGHAVNTPPVRYAAVRLVHAPLISLGAHRWFTDTTNAYRAYSREYLTHPDVRPLRDVFMGYELLAYLSIRATQLGMKACEVPVTRAYPATGKTDRVGVVAQGLVIGHDAETVFVVPVGDPRRIGVQDRLLAKFVVSSSTFERHIAGNGNHDFVADECGAVYRSVLGGERERSDVVVDAGKGLVLLFVVAAAERENRCGQNQYFSHRIISFWSCCNRIRRTLRSKFRPASRFLPECRSAP